MKIVTSGSEKKTIILLRCHGLFVQEVAAIAAAATTAVQQNLTFRVVATPDYLSTKIIILIYTYPFAKTNRPINIGSLTSA